jgi:histidine triad (HIT) family protein
MSVSCIFCKIIREEIPSHKVYEDEKTLAFLDINPTASGHTLLIPKIHIARVEDLPTDDAESLFKTLHKIIRGVQDAMEAPASTIGINNGRESGQEIPHVHIHIIPRRRGGGLGIIQNLEYMTKPSMEELASNAKKIRTKIC